MFSFKAENVKGFHIDMELYTVIPCSKDQLLLKPARWIHDIQNAQLLRIEREDLKLF